MKKSLLSLSLILISPFTFAKYLAATTDVLYYTAEPTLSLSVTHISKTQSLVSVSGEYTDSDLMTSYNEALGNLKKDQRAQRVDPVVAGPVQIDFTDLNLRFESVAKNGQTGPWFEIQELVTRELGQKIAKMSLAKIKVKIATTMSYVELVEEKVLEIDPQMCTQLKGPTIKDLIYYFGKLPKPQEIRSEKAFDNYRRQLLISCFEVISFQNVSSFKDLLELNLRANPPREKIPIFETVARDRKVNSAIEYKMKNQINEVTP
jgi:hypothetical protein